MIYKRFLFRVRLINADKRVEAMGKFTEFYERNYKKLMIIPLLMIVVAGFIVYNFYKDHGDIIEKDVSLKGGIAATVYTPEEISLNDLSGVLNKEFADSNVRKLSEFGSDKQVGIIVEIGEIEETKLKSILEKFFSFSLNDNNYSVEVVGSSLGQSFYQQMIKAILFAFILMAIVVCVIFRSFVPSIAVIFGTSADILVTLAVIELAGLRIGTAGIAAILLLIGYSVDDNMLLTNKVLKRKEGKLIDRVFESFKTGMTMTVTTLIAMIIGYFVSTSPVLKEMFFIIFFGLVADVISTYLMNAPVLIWYAKRKGYE